jgi:hypothetical protein
MGLSILVASSGALPSPNGPFKGPPHGPHFPGRPTGISGGPIYPTGAWPTGFIPSGTATYGPPVLPTPTDCAEEVELVKRFEGPRVGGSKKPWHHYEPKHAKPSGWSRPPPFATGAPFPSGTQGWPTVGPTGGPPAPLWRVSFLRLRPIDKKSRCGRLGFHSSERFLTESRLT